MGCLASMRQYLVKGAIAAMLSVQIFGAFYQQLMSQEAVVQQLQTVAVTSPTTTVTNNSTSGLVLNLTQELNKKSAALEELRLVHSNTLELLQSANNVQNANNNNNNNNQPNKGDSSSKQVVNQEQKLKGGKNKKMMKKMKSTNKEEKEKEKKEEEENEKEQEEEEEGRQPTTTEEENKKEENKKEEEEQEEETRILQQPTKDDEHHLLPPCRVLVMNTADHHTEILESMAKQIPISVLQLNSTTMGCNPTKLVFDYRVRDDFKKHVKDGRKLPRAAYWINYFNKYMKNTTIIDAEDGLTQRTIRNGVLLDHLLNVKFKKKSVPFDKIEAIWKKKRTNYTTIDEYGKPYHAIVEATCYCGTNPNPYIQGRAWVADWMLGSQAHQTRICVFHEKCSAKYHTKTAIWVSPHFDNYFIPSALPLAQLSGKVRPTKWTTKQSAVMGPVICSIGKASYRHFDYFKPYLNAYHEKKTKIKVQLHILGQGDFPFHKRDRKIVTQFDNIADDVKFARHLKKECDIITLLVNPISHPGYFNGTDSDKRLTGSVPPIIAYNKPFLMHEELLELYSKDLLPPALDVPYATFNNKEESYLPAIEKLLNQMKQ